MGDNLGSSEIDKELDEFPSEISELFYDSDNDPEYIPTDNSDSEQDEPFSDHELEDAISELPAASSVFPAASVTCVDRDDPCYWRQCPDDKRTFLEFPFGDYCRALHWNYCTGTVQRQRTKSRQPESGYSHSAVSQCAGSGSRGVSCGVVVVVELRDGVRPQDASGYPRAPCHSKHNCGCMRFSMRKSAAGHLNLNKSRRRLEVEGRLPEPVCLNQESSFNGHVRKSSPYEIPHGKSCGKLPIRGLNVHASFVQVFSVRWSSGIVQLPVSQTVTYARDRVILV
ncbi:hypothetical protein J6590_065424 [Homalodisca vitripennis]|nr:hypothetical protein J6590_065424 [Homalodisca vitripennis]